MELDVASLSPVAEVAKGAVTPLNRGGAATDHNEKKGGTTHEQNKQVQIKKRQRKKTDRHRGGKGSWGQSRWVGGSRDRSRGSGVTLLMYIQYPGTLNKKCYASYNIEKRV